VEILLQDGLGVRARSSIVHWMVKSMVAVFEDCVTCTMVVLARPVQARAGEAPAEDRVTYIAIGQSRLLANQIFVSMELMLLLNVLCPCGTAKLQSS